MVFEVIFQGDAGTYDSCELCKVHDIAAGVGIEVIFNHLFQNQPMPAARPVRVEASMIVFTSLLYDMVCKKHFYFYGRGLFFELTAIEAFQAQPFE